MLIIRFSQRSLGLLSTLILARLLTPDDFGLVAIVTIVIQLFDVVATTGSAQYIIQKTKLDPEDLNTAWTIDIIMKLGLQICLLAAAPVIANYYENAELKYALWISSISLPISALVNPGLVLLQKNLDYRLIVRLSIIQKLISFAVVMLVVYVNPSYWALIIGDIASAITFTVGSYVISSYRPKLNLKRIKRQWSFSQWILLKSIFGYTRSQIDTILVSNFFSIADVGKFNIIKHLTSIPATDIISPAIDPLLSAFSITKKSNPEKLPDQLRVALFIIIFLISPLCTLMWFYPGPIINVLLGDQWTDTHTVLSSLSLLLFAFSLNQLLELYCISQEKVKQIFIYDIASMIIIVAFLSTFPGSDLETFAFHRGALGMVTSILFLVYVNNLTEFSLLKLAKLIPPIFLANVISVLLCSKIIEHSNHSELLQLILLTLTYFSVYLAVSISIYAFLYRRNSDIEQVVNLSRPALTKVIKKLKHQI